MSYSTRLVLVALALSILIPSTASARTRKFCPYQPWYGGHARDCGGHLEPHCSSGPKCDAGLKSYSGSPFPMVIDCPTIDLWLTSIDVPDETLTGGCYDYRPTCDECGGPRGDRRRSRRSSTIPESLWGAAGGVVATSSPCSISLPRRRG